MITYEVNADTAVRIVVLIGAANLVAALGFWAFFWPESFYATVAHFPPYNLHLFHDAGGFQLGIGAALLGGPTMSHRHL